jgi:hypothetical protein
VWRRAFWDYFVLRLGLLETHFRLALGEIARSIIVSSGKLAYGGHLDPKGYTAFLIQELHRYSRRDKPLRVYLAWPEHRHAELNVLKEEKDELGLYGEIIYLDVAGNVIHDFRYTQGFPAIPRLAAWKGACGKPLSDQQPRESWIRSPERVSLDFAPERFAARDSAAICSALTGGFKRVRVAFSVLLY